MRKPGEALCKLGGALLGSLRELCGSYKEFCRSLGTIWEIKEAHVIYRSKSFSEGNCLIAVDLIEI